MSQPWTGLRFWYVIFDADDIIKRKLLLEGDGGNDDRRISSLLKTFLKWSNQATDKDDMYVICVLFMCQIYWYVLFVTVPISHTQSSPTNLCDIC